MSRGPFDEPLFDALARQLGCHDQGASWHRLDLAPMHTASTSDWSLAGNAGIDNDMLAGLPKGFPRFRYVVRANGVCATHLMDVKYTVKRVGRARSVIAAAQLTETLLAGLKGRPLTDFIQLPGAECETIAFASAVLVIGVPHVEVTLSERPIDAR